MNTIAVVIPTFNRRNYLQQVLIDLQQQKNCPELQIIVVVDGSTDGTIELLQEDFPKVHIIHGDQNWFYTKCMNAGFEKALNLKTDYILTMNDDVRLPDNYISNLYQSGLEAGPATIVGSISLTQSTPTRITFSGVKSIRWWRYKQENYMQPFSQISGKKLTGIKPSVVLPGRGMLIPTPILRQLNGFDRRLVQYGSDDDFCLRASKHNIQVLVNYDAIVYSFEKLTGSGNPVNKSGFLQLTQSFFNKYSSRHLAKTSRMIVRHGNPLMLPVTLAIVILGSYWANYKFKP